MLDKEVLKRLKKITENDIEKLSNKQNLTPDEHRSLKDALINMAMLEEECQKAMYDEEGSGYRGYSMSRSYPYSMGMQYDEGYSGRRMRSPSTGRYMGRGYSGHSINDRIISTLEHMMDEADGDYERQTIAKYIEKLDK